jgi:hypothetical protein
VRNPTLSAIVLDPNLTILDINVHDTVMHSLLLLPTNDDKLIMVADGVKK